MSSGKPGGLQAEINVTPLIDVLLVLLIIFLVVMPLMLDSSVLDIPPESTASVEPEPSLTVHVRPDLSFDVSADDGAAPTPVTAADLSSALASRLAKLSGAKVVFLDVDPSVPWREAVNAMDQVRGAGEVRVDLKVNATTESSTK